MSQRGLKVAFDNSLAGKNLTGTGVYASQLIRELSASPEIRLSVLSGWASGSGGGAMLRKLRGLGRLAWSHGYLPLMLRKEKYDVLHAPAFVIPHGCPCPTVVTIHDLSFVLYPHHFGRAWRAYLASCMPSALRSASAIICVSESTKRDLLRFYEPAQEKVYVVHNGLDHSRFHHGAKLDCEWARSIGIRMPYLLHVGAFLERKNIPVLLRAIARLKSASKFEDLQVVLAGKEAPGLLGAQAIDETIRELQLQDTVVKAGHVPDAQLAGLYAGARALAMPSSYEGFGFPVLEAMAVGTPVITSNVSSLPEIAGDAALLIPPGDEQALAGAIATLLDNCVLQERLRSQGMAQAQKFSWKRAAEETIAVYRAVAKP
jgi:glycosyltransferase involved in cell wall biosynthesis